MRVGRRKGRLVEVTHCAGCMTAGKPTCKSKKVNNRGWIKSRIRVRDRSGITHSPSEYFRFVVVAVALSADFLNRTPHESGLCRWGVGQWRWWVVY